MFSLAARSATPYFEVFSSLAMMGSPSFELCQDTPCYPALAQYSFEYALVNGIEGKYQKQVDFILLATSMKTRQCLLKINDYS